MCAGETCYWCTDIIESLNDSQSDAKGCIHQACADKQEQYWKEREQDFETGSHHTARTTESGSCRNQRRSTIQGRGRGKDQKAGTTSTIASLSPPSTAA